MSDIEYCAKCEERTQDNFWLYRHADGVVYNEPYCDHCADEWQCPTCQETVMDAVGDKHCYYCMNTHTSARAKRESDYKKLKEFGIDLRKLVCNAPALFSEPYNLILSKAIDKLVEAADAIQEA